MHLTIKPVLFMFSINQTPAPASPPVKVSAVIILALMIIPISCDSPTDANDDEFGPNEVTMQGHSFSPSELEVEVGTTVTWINTDNQAHTVTSGSDGEHDDLFDSGSMDPGDEFSYQFDEEGTYDYYCIPHVENGMTGTVTVTSGD